MTTAWPEYPSPDFAELERVLRGEQPPRRVHLIELGIDQEILQAFTERCLGQPWTFWSQPRIPAVEPAPEWYRAQVVQAYYRLGYDCLPVWPTWRNHPPVRRWKAQDTAALSTGTREWVDERRGLISSWQEFETFPWEEIEVDTSACEYTARHLPPGMKMTVSATLFEHVMENLLGYLGLFYLLHDDRDLVVQVFERWGEIVYDYYAAVVGMEEVGAIFHADDLGYKTSTLVSPEVLRQLFFPWLRRYAALAHAHGKTFWYHCCGNVYHSELMEDLIEKVRIDAFHAFQDVILPVGAFKARYGERVAALGGVDVDALARLDDAALRVYVREILDQCMPGGRFALGAGNSVTNYVPPSNYLAMLEEARRWQPERP